ncbi:MAG: SprT-like domain-containing protein [Pyrinomonadaceae bacterium]
MINTAERATLQKLSKIYRETFESYNHSRTIPEVEVAFYPYTAINHTIRVRDGRVYVRIADICHDMSREGHVALAHILVAKLLRRRVPKWARDIYSEQIKTPEMRDRANKSKLERGRKIVTTDKGEVYNLTQIFRELNKEYFRGRIAKPVLTWSARKTYRILGHHDSTHKTIVVSRSLDSKDVPRYVVEYIVFHEMLHIKHPTVHHNGRRYNHTPAFRADEEQFEYFEKAEKWIERNVRKLKRNAKKK